MNSFGSVRFAGGFLRRLAAVTSLCLLILLPARGAEEVNLLAFGDWGCGSSGQVRTAAGLAAYVKGAAGTKFDATLLLGDNFYTTVADAESPIWSAWFEKMYDPAVLTMPFYALLGNHDWEHGGVTARAELAYQAAHPESRWKMPAKYYRVDLPAGRPLVSILMLDGGLRDQEWDEEAAWLDGELAKERSPWMICASHYPLYSNSEHADSKTMQKRIGSLLNERRIDFYLAGHDHNLQHLQIETNFTSHIVSGAGGRALYPMYRDDRGPFTASTNGFVHLRLTPERASVRIVSESGKTMHLFERTPDGQVAVKETTGIQKAVKRPEKKPAKKKDAPEG